jgi:DNA-binding IclR family transcriptional regulator
MCAIEEMKRLWDISEETVTLDIQVGTQRIHLQDIPSKHDLKVSREGMLKTPLYAGATGKVLLSQLGDNEVGVILKNMDLVPLTQNTITKKEILLEQLKKIRKQAHAVSFGERIDGAIGIAVSIKNYFHPTALSILGPEYRLRPRVKELIEEMRVSKRFIEESIMETAKAS